MSEWAIMNELSKKNKPSNLYNAPTQKVTRKDTDPCKQEPPSIQEQQKYFNEVINNYATQNEDLLEHLKQIEDRLTVMETTAPALMVYNLFKEIKSETDLDFGEYVTQMVEQAELGIKTDLFNVFEATDTQTKITKTDSNDSTTIAQLHQLEALLNEEKQVKNRIAQMVTLESDTKEAMEILGTPEMAMAFEMQNKFDTGKFGKVNVPLTSASPLMIDKADKLCCILKNIENCCACKMVKIEGLKSTVEYLSQVLRYAAKHEEDRDKPEIPEAKKAIHDILMEDKLHLPSSSTNERNKDFHSLPYSKSHASHSPGVSRIIEPPMPIFQLANEDDLKDRKSYVLDKHIVQYRVDTITNPFQQYTNLKNASSTIHPASIESLLVRGPKSYINKYNQPKFDIRTDQPKNLEDDQETLINPPPNSFLVTSYNNCTLDADYILYKREELSNSIELKPEFIKLPVITGGTNHQTNYLNNSQHTTSTELSSKFNILNTDDLFYSVLIPKNENKMNNSNKQTETIENKTIEVKSSKQAETIVSQNDQISQLTETTIQSSKSQTNVDETDSPFFVDTDESSQHDQISYTVGNMIISNYLQLSDPEISKDDILKSDVDEKSTENLANEVKNVSSSLDNTVSKKKKSKKSMSKEDSISTQDSFTKKNTNVSSSLDTSVSKKKKSKKSYSKEDSISTQDSSPKKSTKHKKKSLKETRKGNSSDIIANKSGSRMKKTSFEDEETIPKVSSNLPKNKSSHSKDVNLISNEKIELDSEYEEDTQSFVSKHHLGDIEKNVLSFIESIVSSIVPTSPSRSETNHYKANQYVEPKSFLDISHTNQRHTDVVNVREGNISQTDASKYYQLANLNAIVPDITVKYYVSDKISSLDKTEGEVEDGHKQYTQIVRPKEVNLMDNADKFSEVIVKYNVPLPAYLLKEQNVIDLAKTDENAVEKVKEENDEKLLKQETLNDTGVEVAKLDTKDEYLLNRKEQHLLWFNQSSKIEMPMKPVHSDSTKDHCTCSKRCFCIETTQNKTDKYNVDCDTNNLLDEDQNYVSWFDKNPSLEIAHHSFVSNDQVSQYSCRSKVNKNAHILKGGQSVNSIKSVTNPKQSCKDECQSSTTCPKYNFCGNITCTSNFSQIVYNEKLPDQTPQNSSNSHQKNSCQEHQSQTPHDATKHLLGSNIDPTKFCQSFIQVVETKNSTNIKAICDCKTSCECDKGIFPDSVSNLTKSTLNLNSKTEVPSTTILKSNHKCVQSHTQSSLEQKIPSNLSTIKPTSELQSKKNISSSMNCDESHNLVKSSKCLNHDSSKIPDSIETDRNFCCLLYNLKSKECLNTSNTLHNSLESTCHSNNTPRPLLQKNEPKDQGVHDESKNSLSTSPGCCKANIKNPESKKMPNQTSMLSDSSKLKNTINVSIFSGQKSNNNESVEGRKIVCCKAAAYDNNSEPKKILNEGNTSNLPKPNNMVKESLTPEQNAINIKFDEIKPPCCNAKILNETSTLLNSSCTKNLTNKSSLSKQKLINEPCGAIKNTAVCCKSRNAVSKPKEMTDLTKLPTLLTESFKSNSKNLDPKMSITIPNPPPNSPALLTPKCINTSKNELESINSLNDIEHCKAKRASCPSKVTFQQASSILIPSDIQSIGSFFNLNAKKLLERFNKCKCSFQNQNEQEVLDILIKSLHSFSNKSLVQETFNTTVENKCSTNVSKKSNEDVLMNSMVNQVYNDLSTAVELKISKENNQINSGTEEKSFSEIVQMNDSSYNECMEIKNYMVSQVMNELSNIDKLFLKMDQDGVMKVDNKGIDKNSVILENNVNSFVQALIDKFKNLSSTLPSKLLLNENSNQQFLTENTRVINDSFIQNKLKTISNLNEIQNDNESSSDNNDIHLEQGITNDTSLKENEINIKNQIKTEIDLYKKEILNPKEVSQETHNDSLLKENEVNLENQIVIETVSRKKEIPNQKEINSSQETRIDAPLKENKVSLQHEIKIETLPSQKQISNQKEVHSKQQTQSKSFPQATELALNHQTNNKTVLNKTKDSLKNQTKPIIKKLDLEQETKTIKTLSKKKVVSNTKKVNIVSVPIKKKVNPNTKKQISGHKTEVLNVPVKNVITSKHQTNIVPEETVTKNQAIIENTPHIKEDVSPKEKNKTEVSVESQTNPENFSISSENKNVNIHYETVVHKQNISSNEKKATIGCQINTDDASIDNECVSISPENKNINIHYETVFHKQEDYPPSDKHVTKSIVDRQNNTEDVSINTENENINVYNENVGNTRGDMPRTDKKANIESPNNNENISINTENVSINTESKNMNVHINLYKPSSELRHEEIKNLLAELGSTNKTDEACQTNFDGIITHSVQEVIPQHKDHVTQWSQITTHNQSAITNSEIVLRVDNTSSACTIKSHLSEDTFEEVVIPHKLSDKVSGKINPLILNRKVVPAVKSSKSSTYSTRMHQSPILKKISTKNDFPMIKSVSTKSSPSPKSVTSTSPTEKRSQPMNRKVSVQALKKKDIANKPSIKQSKTSVSYNFNQNCLLTNIASFRGVSYNVLTTQITPTTTSASEFINERKRKALIEKRASSNSIYDGFSQISTIRGSYKKEIIGLIDYYKKLLQEINNRKLIKMKKVIRRSQTSLCSVCAKISDEVSLCSCDSNCST